MRGFGDNSLANLPQPRSVEEVAAIASALESEAERQYSAFSRELGTFGTPAVAALLEELCREHRARAGGLEAKATSGQDRNIAEENLARLLPRALSENAAAVCDLYGLTPYRVLAFAVSLAQQSFKLYSYLAAAADERVRGYAEQLAGEELERAARLRARRRQAYHRSPGPPRNEAYPAAGLVETLADLLAAALAIEDRLAHKLTKAKEGESELSSTCQATREKLEELRRAAEQAGPPSGPMADELAKFSHSAPTNGRAGRDRSTAKRQLLTDCERAFTFYDAVASAPADEAVMLQAQDLSRAALERIRQVNASADAPNGAERDGGGP